MATECSSARHCRHPDLPVPIAVDSSLRPTGRFKHTCINCLRGIHGPCGEDFDLLQLRKLDKAKLNKAARETTVFTNNDQICFSCIETCGRVIEDGDQGAPRSRPKRNAQPNVRIGSPQAAASKKQSVLAFKSQGRKNAPSSKKNTTSSSSSKKPKSTVFRDDYDDDSELSLSSTNVEGDDDDDPPSSEDPTSSEEEDGEDEDPPSSEEEDGDDVEDQNKSTSTKKRGRPTSTGTRKKKKKKKQRKNKTKKRQTKRPPVYPVTTRAGNLVSKGGSKSQGSGKSSSATVDLTSLAVDGEEGAEDVWLQPGEDSWKDYHLCIPTSVSSEYWKYYLVYHQNHRDMQGLAKCRLPGCKSDIKVTSGIGGLKTHLRSQHKNVYDRQIGLPIVGTASTSTSTDASKKRKAYTQGSLGSHVKKVLTIEERKKRHLANTTWWTIDQNQPFTAVDQPSFRSMFNNFHDEADKITSRANHVSVRENVRQYGVLAKAATKMEMRKHKGSITTDHWTGPDSLSYTTTTFHYIEDFELKSMVIDFKVFKGSTTGERIFEDQKEVIEVSEGDFLVVMAVTDTTGNMGSLGKYLREAEIEHSYCTDHNFHRNAILAFNDNNIPGANNTMKASRDLVQVFTSSTQAMTQLKGVQSSDLSDAYEGKNALKALQDVRTRWWSTFRFAERLIYLRPALDILKSAKNVDFEMLEDEQWVVLEQIVGALSKMAKFQRVLEGESYVTGSMVVIAVFRIRAHYVNILSLNDTLEPVRFLVKKLLDDFDERFAPADRFGKVKYTGKPDIGHGNRYTGVHPYFFMASLLDIRVKNLLCKMMLPGDYELLKKDLLTFMIAQLQGDKGAESDIEDEGNTDATPTTAATTATETQDDEEDDDLLGDLEVGVATGDDATTPQELEDITKECELELKRYLDAPGMSVRKKSGDGGGYNNPLHWWKTRGSKSFPILWKLAKMFLAIPATSAPSERIWSRSAGVLTARRANLDEEMTSGIMFLKENSQVLRKYWEEITKDMKDALSLEFCGIPLLDDDDDDDGEEIDVGQRACILN